MDASASAGAVMSLGRGAAEAEVTMVDLAKLRINGPCVGE